MQPDLHVPASAPEQALEGVGRAVQQSCAARELCLYAMVLDLQLLRSQEACNACSCTACMHQELQACRQMLLAMEKPHDLATLSCDQHSQHSCKQHA